MFWMGMILIGIGAVLGIGACFNSEGTQDWGKRWPTALTYMVMTLAFFAVGLRLLGQI